MNQDDLVELRAGDTRLTLAPAIGGGVASLAWRGREILRPANAAALAKGDPLGLANFPLVPFAGRITQGRFNFNGRDVILPVNLAGEVDAIHGQGWRLPWRLAGRTDKSATLRLDHPAGDWPWTYQALQHFTVTEAGLVHALSVTNQGSAPMPAGLGLHPYFPRDPDTWLEADVDGVVLTPAGPPAPPPDAWDWRGGRRLTLPVDNQFSGWSGAAAIGWPSRGHKVTLWTSPAVSRLVVYAPAAGDIVCVEPVSHQLDAVNRSPGGAAHGMEILGAGQSLTLTAHFQISQFEG